MTLKNNPVIGLGDESFNLVVCLANRPDTPCCQQLSGIEPVVAGQLDNIIAHTGNHWRKIFNIYAKLLFQLDNKHFQRWQQYRDECLLTQGSAHALVFSTVPSMQPKDSPPLTLVAGKTFAQQQGVLNHCTDQGDGFYVNRHAKIIVTPYFDYRPLSNLKIERLVALIQSFE